ncbi:MAG TPA: flavin prenyltransferase UbiX [Pirellulales bacterium]|jgi:4-hydroxy-3-polyprenylbenzoate decarboxylase|nr:flavin prenyltransferase UbiX [Pirellulales bacterium]
MSRMIVLGITGASGAIYAQRLLETLLHADCRVQLSISQAGAAVIKQELNRAIDLKNFRLRDLLAADSGNVEYYHYEDLFAPMASGSARSHGMVVCPCSGGTLSAIAHAASGNLIHRAADVHLKERRKLVLVPRETPLSLPMIENLRACAAAGAVVLPAMPGFYHGATTLDDLVNFVVARICDHLGVEHNLMKRWGDD